MNRLSSSISLDRVINKASLRSQKRIFEVLSQLLQDKDLGISSDMIYQKLFERERIGSTAVGKQLAVPHCRIDGITLTRLAVLTLDEPVEYDDGAQSVSIFVAAIFPEDISDEHTKFMAELVKFLKSSSMLERIHNADSNEMLYQLFSK